MGRKSNCGFLRTLTLTHTLSIVFSSIVKANGVSLLSPVCVFVVAVDPTPDTSSAAANSVEGNMSDLLAPPKGGLL
ncbi:hypothetical protein EYF80_047865 [Liparis tanakae]|uniref:Secreted protein n=1 Tax=Liparis tanakae TaxID=230148 RepID=A0A4Z2FLR8_9TELE|nr:hypothetical protein EYF80_047865 [Liparis tanakae]